MMNEEVLTSEIFSHFGDLPTLPEKIIQDKNDIFQLLSAKYIFKSLQK